MGLSIDKEKVIKGMETCLKYLDRECPINCSYYEKCIKYGGRVVAYQAVFRDAIAWLKKQEAVEPINSNGTFRCGNCNHIVGYNDGHGRGYQNNYCSCCGILVEWND